MHTKEIKINPMNSTEVVMNKLKDCPFCNGDAIVIEGFYRTTPESDIFELYAIKCLDCDVRGPTDINQQIAMDKWNARISEK